MRINTNIMALNAQNKLTLNQNGVEKSIQRLSSGLRINGAADDASGLAISEKMRAQIRGLSQAQSNAQDGISLIQTAEGALQQTTDILQRMRELVIKAQNTGVLTEEDKTSISNELSTLRDEIDRIAESTTFNGKQLLNGGIETKLEKAEITSLALRAGSLKMDVSNAKAGTAYQVSFEVTHKVPNPDTYSMITELSVGKFTLKWKEGDQEKIAYSTEEYMAGDNGVSVQNVDVYFDEAGVGMHIDGLVAGALEINPVTYYTSGKGGAEFKIGANTYNEDIIAVTIGDMSSKGLNNIPKEIEYEVESGNVYKAKYKEGEKFSIDISTSEEANKTLEAIDYALNKVSTQRAKLGTAQNRMQYAISNLSTTEENLTAAESRIRDVDMAEEMVAYTKASILNQSAMSMLAQANQQPQNILSLLQ